MRPVDVAQCSVEVFLSILSTERLQHIDCKEVSEIECRWLQSIAIACNHLSIWDPRSKIQDAMGVLDLKSWIHHLFLWDPGIQDPRSKMPWGSWIWNLGSILDPWIQDFKSFHCSHVLPCPKSCQAGHLTTRCQQFVTLKPCYSSVCEVASKSSARTETLCFPPWWLAKTGVGNATPGQALLKPYQKVPNSSSDRGSVVWQFATNLVDHWSHLSQIQASWSINSSKASSSVTVFVLRLDCFPFLLLHPLERFVERSLKFLLWMIFGLALNSELQIATGCLHLGSPQLFCLAPRNPFARLHRNINGKLVKSARCLCTPFPMRDCQLSGFRLSFLPVIKTPSTKPFSLSINRPADLRRPLSFVCGPAHAWNGAFRSSCIFRFCLQLGLQLRSGRDSFLHLWALAFLPPLQFHLLAGSSREKKERCVPFPIFTCQDQCLECQ